MNVSSVSHNVGETATRTTGARKWLPLVAVCAGTFMLLVDVTIVIVALPEMAEGLHASLADLQWVMSLYALVLAALVLTAGSLADRVGRRRVYVGGLVGFAAASLVCGLSGSAGVLIAARGFQGLAAAAMFATTLALISSRYTGRDRGIAFGIWAAINGAASAAGPLLGGLLTANLGWRWIFFVNLPVCVAAILLTLLAVRESRDPQARPLDLPGMVTFTTAAAAFVYALIRGSWGSGFTLGLFTVAVAALVAFVVVEGRRQDPMLELSLLRGLSFPTLLITAALLPASAWAFLAYQTLWLQTVLGLTAIEAGFVMLPASLTTFVVSIVIGRMSHKSSPRLLIGSGMLIIGVGAFAETAITPASGWFVALPGLFLVGLGAGLVLGPLSAAAMAAVPGSRAGMAAGAVNAFRQLGYAVGVATLGVAFRNGLDGSLDQGLAGQLSSGHTQAIVNKGGSTGEAVRHAFAAALDQTYTVAAVFGVAAGIGVLLFVRSDNADGETARQSGAAKIVESGRPTAP